jgi:hypothetical protein
MTNNEDLQRSYLEGGIIKSRFGLALSWSAHAAAVAFADVADIRFLFLEAKHIFFD